MRPRPHGVSPRTHDLARFDEWIRAVTTGPAAVAKLAHEYLETLPAEPANRDEYLAVANVVGRLAESGHRAEARALAERILDVDVEPDWDCAPQMAFSLHRVGETALALAFADRGLARRPRRAPKPIYVHEAIDLLAVRLCAQAASGAPLRAVRTTYRRLCALADDRLHYSEELIEALRRAVDLAIADARGASVLEAAWARLARDAHFFPAGAPDPIEPVFRAIEDLIAEMPEPTGKLNSAVQDVISQMRESGMLPQPPDGRDRAVNAGGVAGDEDGPGQR